MRLIDADALRKQFEDRSLEDFTYLHFIDAIDDAPTVEPRTEYGTDGQAYRLFISGGQVVPDMLQGWKYEERPRGEWIVVSNDIINHHVDCICSKCGHAGDFQDKFCRECGVDMRGADNETDNRY